MILRNAKGQFTSTVSRKRVEKMSQTKEGQRELIRNHENRIRKLERDIKELRDALVNQGYQTVIDCDGGCAINW